MWHQKLWAYNSSVLVEQTRLELRPATSHSTGFRIPHYIIILVNIVETLLIFYDHKILWDQESIKWERRLFYMYSLLYSVYIVTFWPFCQGIHQGIIDACKEDLVAPSDDLMEILSLLRPRDFNLWWRWVAFSSNSIAQKPRQEVGQFHQTSKSPISNRNSLKRFSKIMLQDIATHQNYTALMLIHVENLSMSLPPRLKSPSCMSLPSAAPIRIEWIRHWAYTLVVAGKH